MFNFSCGFIGLNTLRYMCLVLFSERFLSRMFPNMVKYCFGICKLLNELTCILKQITLETKQCRYIFHLVINGVWHVPKRRVLQCTG